MNAIKVFEFNHLPVRTLSIDGEPWFVAKDVAETLGYERARDAISDHCKGAVKRRLPSAGGEQEFTIIPERDVYRLIMRSKLPSAQAFEDWVTGEVLPAIRKTGSYINPKFAVPQTYPEALRLAANLAEENETLKPKALIHDRIADSKGYKTIREVAAVLNIGANTLFSILRDKGILFKENGGNLPKREHIEAGRFIVIEEPFHKNGEDHVYSKVMVTPKGELWLAKILSEDAA